MTPSIMPHPRPAPDPKHFLQLLDVVDRLNPESPAGRERLLASARALVDHQALAVSADQIDQAVVDHLTQQLGQQATRHTPGDISSGVGPMGNENLMTDAATGHRFDFDWKRGWLTSKSRPKNLAEREEKLEFFKRWPWQISRWLVRTPGRLLMIMVPTGLATFSLAAHVMERADMKMFFDQHEHDVILALCVAGAAIFSTLNMRMVGLLIKRLASDANSAQRAPAPDQATQAQWAQHPAVRDYVHQCLTGPAPFLMEGDVQVIKKQLWENDVKARKQASVSTRTRALSKKERQAMAQTQAQQDQIAFHTRFGQAPTSNMVTKGKA
jgi:hypothetical protein